MDRKAAIELGHKSGVENVNEVLREQGRAAVLATLVPGHVGWDEGAINAGVARLKKVPPEHEEAYYGAYAAAARERAREIAELASEPVTETLASVRRGDF